MSLNTIHCRDAQYYQLFHLLRKQYRYRHRCLRKVLGFDMRKGRYAGNICLIQGRASLDQGI